MEEHEKMPSMEESEKKSLRETPPDFCNTMMTYAGPAFYNQTPPVGIFTGGPFGNPGETKPMAGPDAAPKGTVYCICPGCGMRTEGSEFCTECGQPLKDAPRYRDCSCCGARIPADARFCSECGSLMGAGQG